MKNRHGNAISWTAIIIAVIALCASLFSIEKISAQGTDLIGWLIGILAIMVTTLIGWQIFALMDIRKMQKEVAQNKDAAFYESSRNMAVTTMAISDYFYSTFVGKDQSEKERIYMYIYYRVSSILHASRINDFETCRVVIKVLKETIRPENILLNESNKKHLFDLLSNVENARLIEDFSALLAWVSSFPVEET